MESVLNKLRDRVSSTVYQVTSNISTALPGNALTREYDLLRHVASAGPRLTWKIYDAVKKSTKQEAALFVLDKKQLDRYNKRERELVLDVIRKGVAQLTRLRHPSMLTVQHPLEESRDSLAFATEPVVASLANLLGHHENCPSPVPAEMDNFVFHDVEIKHGLLQLAEGLSFLHNDAKLLHRNVAPENVMVNKNGAWKLSGFDFAIGAQNNHETPLKFPTMPLANCDTPPEVMPNLDYVAPEYLEKGSCVESSADLFSLGALTYTLYNKGKPLLSTGGVFSYSQVDKLKKLPPSTWNCIPEDSRSHIKLLLSVDHTLRPDAVQFSKLHFFEDILVKTLQYLDSLYQWDNLQKSHFYKGLPEILAKMPKRVKLHRIVSGLAKEFVNPEMVPFVLPNILLIAEEASDDEFQKWILPELINVFKMQEPIQIGIILMQKMDLLVNKCKSHPESLKEHLLPLIYRSLESEAQQIQELCLNVVPSIIHLADYNAMKNSLLPRLKKLMLNTKLLSVRVNCLLCVGKILDYMDKWLVLDDIFPALVEIPSREPAVIMAIVGIYNLTMTSNKLGITKDILASKVIPFLVPLSIENGLSLQQFQTIMSIIRDMLNKVEEEQSTKLEQLDSIKNQQSLFNSSLASSTSLDGFHNLTSSGVTNTNNSMKNKPVGLSLEEKERLAREKEHAELLKRQPELVPRQAEVSKPKDLTSTLISNNLTSLTNLTPKNIPQPTATMSFVNNSLSSQLNNLQPMQSHPTQFNVFNTNQLSQPSKPFASPFDNLSIPELKKSTPQPLNAMTSGSTSMNFGWSMAANSVNPLAPNYSLSQSNSTAKPLSKSEVEDLLS